MKVRQDRNRSFDGDQILPCAAASAVAPRSPVMSAGASEQPERWAAACPAPPAAGQGAARPFLRQLISKSYVQLSPGRRCHAHPRAGGLLAPLPLPGALGHNRHHQGHHPGGGD